MIFDLNTVLFVVLFVIRISYEKHLERDVVCLQTFEIENLVNTSFRK